ncbi:uncharacterized protein F5891DRAFT_986917 [Suillus fuscotomentosus]|uniref:Heterokaryon incompatibility domain-containing protein n=1 Tax=Suillus fuscotomentosus TaxID=1912939 RepID=A0AAD4DQZ4_9AGAM|nr:uncharacterized protein F5891DRAFT_986917 [Suillus fuscotomentosus]KAG1890608.1 hypothetical protein F5891DRAFT_986917 [Suillus fuscotomentosus]
MMGMFIYAFGTGSSYFAHRSKVKLGQKLYAEALSDAEKVIELNPSSYLGYELKHAALHGSQRYEDAFKAFTIMLSKLDDAPDPQIRQLRQQYASPSEVEDAIRQAIHAQLENAPLRLINTSTGRLCDRDAQINAFMESTEHKELLHTLVIHVPLQMEPIKEAVAKYFSWVMLSHRWERKEPLLHDIQGRDIYDLDAVGTVVKLQKFCEVARDAGHRWAWSDTCCINQNNNVEVQHAHHCLPIGRASFIRVWRARKQHLEHARMDSSGVPRSKVVLFYQADWTLYLDDRSRNHKHSLAITQELERSTGISARALVDFRPGMIDAREKLRWASTRVTTLQEDIAYSLFGIFGVHLPVIYGEKRQNALGRLLQEIIAHSGDITALDWVGQSSNFNSCLPADIFSYKALSCALPSLSERDMQNSVSSLRNNIFAVESASKLIRRRPGQDGDTCFNYDVKADGLQDLLVITEDKLVQFSPARRTRRTFLLVRPWNRHDLGLINFADETQSVEDWPEPGSPGYNESTMRELRLIVRLGQPFGGLLLAQQWGGEYKRIASDNNIIAQVKDTAFVYDMMDIRMMEIL